jgi:hypothetical protein
LLAPAPIAAAPAKELPSKIGAAVHVDDRAGQVSHARSDSGNAIRSAISSGWPIRSIATFIAKFSASSIFDASTRDTFRSAAMDALRRVVAPTLFAVALGWPRVR